MKGIFSIVAAVIFFLGAFGVPSVHAVFVEPGDIPPGGTEIAPPINTSETTQTKQGSLTLDGPNPVRLEIGNASEGDNKLCLNGVCVTSLGVSDYVQLQGTDGSSTPGIPQSGFSELRAKSTQQYALRAEGSEPTTDWTAGLYGVASTSSSGSFERYGVFGRTQYDSQLSYGVYGYADPALYPNAYAGYFEGRVKVIGDLLVAPGGGAQICLNGECLTSWPFLSSTDFVRLQKGGGASSDDGAVNISGSGTFSSIVLGEPVAGTPPAITCGDGVCTAVNGEDSANCSLDCFTITDPPTVQTFVTSATIAWDTGAQPTTGSVDYGLSTYYDQSVSDANFGTTHGPLTLDNLEENATYFYRIVSISESGAATSYLGQFTTLPSDSTPPSQVANLRLNGSVTWDTIPLAWDPATDNAAVLHYLLERKEGLGSWAQVGSPIVGTTYTDTGLNGETAYTYRVTAVDTALNLGPPSAEQTFTTTAVPTDQLPPSVPQNVSHTGLAYYNQVDLTWGASADDPTPPTSGMKEYNIFRKLNAEPDTEWKLIATVADPATAYTDTGPLVNATAYDYAVSAVDNAGNESARSAAHTITTEPDSTAPSAPANLSLTQTPTSAVIKFSWQKSTDTGGSGLAGYRLYRYDCTLDPHPQGDHVEVCNPDPVFDVNDPTWELVEDTSLWYASDTSFVPGRQYQYAVIAYDNAGNLSGSSNILKVYAPSDTCADDSFCDVPNSQTPVCCDGICAPSCGGDGSGGRGGVKLN